MIDQVQRAVALLFRQYIRGRLLGGFRRRGLMVYFRAVNGARRLLVTLAIIGVLLHLMTISLLGTIVTTAWIFVPDERTRLYVLLGAFATLFVLPLLGGCFLLSERFWMRLSGASSLLEERPGA